MEKTQTDYSDLPPECLLRIIAFLTLADVAALLRTSRLWHLVISDNESVIFRHLAAICESMDVPSETLGDTLKGWVSVEASKVQNWKQYCQLQTFTAKRWRGWKGAYMLCDVFGASQQMEVHRIKIDTEKSLLVMSGGEVDTILASNSALVVHCLRNPHQPAIFRLGQVSEYAHVEMSNGFVVFTCEESTALEVWRWAQDQDTDPLDRQPTEHQISVYERAVEQAGFSPGSPHRGELVPMGMIRNPADSRATRLAYPTLCVGSRAGDSLWLWDIRGRRLTQTIDIEPSPYANSGFAMLYVDVNETHAFVATHTVSVYSRETSQCVFQLTKQHLALLFNSIHLPDQQAPTSHPAHGSFELSNLPAYRAPNKRQVQVAFQQIQDIVLAVHVSPSGDDFVALTARGCLVHVSGLKSSTLSVSEGGASEPTTSSSTSPQPPGDSNTRSPSLEKYRISAVRIDRGLGNLAYDGNRILAFGTYGLCILHVVPQPNVTFESTIGEGPTLKLYPFPVNNVARVFPFGHQGRTYLECSCLQMTQDSLWVAWEPTASVIDDFEMPYVKVVGMMDFAQPSNCQAQAPRPASA